MLAMQTITYTFIDELSTNYCSSTGELTIMGVFWSCLANQKRRQDELAALSLCLSINESILAIPGNADRFDEYGLINT
jgi:hypothetical protein